MTYENFSRIGPSKFRKYSLFNNGVNVGEVYETQKKISFFKGYNFRELDYFDKSYYMYALGMGEEGYKFPIYDANDIQIAQIEIGCVIYNDLHNYKLYIKQEELMNIVVFLCAYMYVDGSFKAGEKHTSSKVKTVTVTKNKLELEKYDPNFIKSIEK
jgi:hypothetical protein